MLGSGWRKKHHKPLHIQTRRGAGDWHTLNVALIWFTNNRIRQRRYLSAKWEEQITEGAFIDFLEDEHELLIDLIGGLVCGDLIASGFRAGEMNPLSIPAEWWSDVTVDLVYNTAVAHGTVLSGIKITRAKPLASEPTAVRAACSEQEAAEWMLKRAVAIVEDGKPVPKKTDIINQCRAEIGATFNVAKAAYGKLPKGLRLFKGKPPSPK